MYIQKALPTERLITHLAAKWPLTTTYALMCFQITLLSEYLIAHITGVLALLLKVSESIL
jgi:hypothetical protein